MTKTLLILSGGEKSVEIVQALRAMGQAVVVSDADPQAPAFAFADSCLIADVYGPSETAAAAERYSRKIRKIDGILSVTDAALTIAMVTERLRLPGPPPHVSELIGDRLATRRCFASAGIAAPWHAEIFTPQELQRAIIARGRDLTLKPVEKLGPSTEVRLIKLDDPAAAFLEVRSQSPSERVLVELAKDPVCLPAFLLAGRCHMRAEESIRALVERAASALGVGDGPVVAEITRGDGAAQIVELSPRLAPSGEFLDAAIAQACGESISPGDLTA